MDCRHSAQRNAVINIHINCARRILKLAKKLKSHNEKVLERAWTEIFCSRFTGELFFSINDCLSDDRSRKNKKPPGEKM
jgi:hypothetical protein